MNETDGNERLLTEGASAMAMAVERGRWDVVEHVLALTFVALAESVRPPTEDLIDQAIAAFVFAAEKTRFESCEKALAVVFGFTRALGGP
jgi:hypothetical protein